MSPGIVLALIWILFIAGRVTLFALLFVAVIHGSPVGLNLFLQLLCKVLSDALCDSLPKICESIFLPGTRVATRRINEFAICYLK
jgi:hypothetical protein